MLFKFKREGTMQLNEISKKILDYLQIGENVTTLRQIASDLNISEPTTHKYIRLLHDGGYINKKIHGVSGGTAKDKKKVAIIIKYHK